MPPWTLTTAVKPFWIRKCATWALRAHPVPPERKAAGFDVAWAGVSGEMAALGVAGVV